MLIDLSNCPVNLQRQVACLVRLQGSQVPPAQGVSIVTVFWNPMEKECISICIYTATPKNIDI